MKKEKKRGVLSLNPEKQKLRYGNKIEQRQETQPLTPTCPCYKKV